MAGRRAVTMDQALRYGAATRAGKSQILMEIRDALPSAGLTGHDRDGRRGGGASSKERAPGWHPGTRSTRRGKATHT